MKLQLWPPYRFAKVLFSHRNTAICTRLIFYKILAKFERKLTPPTPSSISWICRRVETDTRQLPRNVGSTIP